MKSTTTVYVIMLLSLKYVALELKFSKITNYIRLESTRLGRGEESRLTAPPLVRALSLASGCEGKM